MIKFDSWLEEYKNPLGAMRVNAPARFTVKTDTSLDIKYVNLVIRGETEQKTELVKISPDTYSAQVTVGKAGYYRYRFELVRSDGTMLFVGTDDGHTAKTGDWLPEWELAVYESDFHTSDVTGAVMYQIFPDRFFKADGVCTEAPKNARIIHESWSERPLCVYDSPDYKCNDYFMGNLKGIEQKLDYLKSLGVTHLYLNPVFESAENHRYSTSDYMKIDPYLGSNADFESLCKTAAKKNIKIIIDGVFSHTGADSIYFNKYSNYDSIGAYNSEQSPYYDWYNFTDYPDKYECWWGFETLPNTKEMSPSFREFITGENGVIKYWLKKGANGIRLDVADELPDEFLECVRKCVKSHDKDALVIGEVWENAVTKVSYGARRKFLLGKQCDTVMNYPFRNAIINYVKSGDACAFYNNVTEIISAYPPESVNTLMNMLSTHDTDRILSVLGSNDRPPRDKEADAKLTAAQRENGIKLVMTSAVLQYTLPGIPCIFYGDEAGAEGFGDPACRCTYPWGREDKNLLNFYKKLGIIRGMYGEDFSKPIRFEKYRDGVVTYTRGAIRVTVNRSDKPIEFSGDILLAVNNDGNKLHPFGAVITKGE